MKALKFKGYKNILMQNVIKHKTCQNNFDIQFKQLQWKDKCMHFAL